MSHSLRWHDLLGDDDSDDFSDEDGELVDDEGEVMWYSAPNLDQWDRRANKQASHFGEEARFPSPSPFPESANKHHKGHT
jgi:hypothetical protein